MRYIHPLTLSAELHCDLRAYTLAQEDNNELPMRENPILPVDSTQIIQFLSKGRPTLAYKNNNDQVLLGILPVAKILFVCINVNMGTKKLSDKKF